MPEMLAYGSTQLRGAQPRPVPHRPAAMRRLAIHSQMPRWTTLHAARDLAAHPLPRHISRGRRCHLARPPRVSKARANRPARRRVQLGIKEVSSRPPACETTPVPSADTMTLRLAAVRYTRKVPFELAGTGPSTSPILPVQRRFSYPNYQVRTTATRKPEARGPSPLTRRLRHRPT